MLNSAPHETWNVFLSLNVVQKAPNATLISLSDSSGKIVLVKVTCVGCTLVHEASVHTAEARTFDATDRPVILRRRRCVYIRKLC